MKKMFRRDFLKIVGLGATMAPLVPLLQGCSAAASVTPLASTPRLPTTTTIPTETTQTQDYSELLDVEISLYAQTYNLSPSEIVARVDVRDFTDPGGKGFQAAVDPETDIPLLITDEESHWTRATLRELADKGGIRIGMKVDEGSGNLYQFNYGLLNSGWDWSIQRDSPERYDYRYEDNEFYIAKFAGIKDFRLMHLINPHWMSLPKWLVEGLDAGTITRQGAIDHMTNYIRAVMKHFKGKVQEYVVVNEPYMTDAVGPGVRDPLLEAIGPEYIDIAFQIARDADPFATLVLNHWGNDWFDDIYTSQTVGEIVDRLYAKGLIDKVGLQFHIGPGYLDLTEKQVGQIITSYPIEAAITEFDVDIQVENGSQQDRWMRQARVYETIIGGVLKAKVKDIGFWGATDTDFEAFLAQEGLPSQPMSQPRMWESEGVPKPAYYAVRKVLLTTVGIQR
jgi:endo-1,4-beta-xylanase